MFSRSKSKESELIYILGNYCGVGLIDVIMVNKDVLHPQSQWMFTSELRRLIGFKSEKDFTNTASAFFTGTIRKTSSRHSRRLQKPWPTSGDHPAMK
jgi:hypothetical protein